jgi:hypothetical protein
LKRFKLSSAAVLAASIVAAMVASAAYGMTKIVNGQFSVVTCVSNGGANGCPKSGYDESMPTGLAVISEGGRVATAAFNSNAIDIFARDRATGDITQEGNQIGCIAENGGSGGECTTAHGMHGPTNMVSKDSFLYWTAATDGAVGFAQLNLNHRWYQLQNTHGCTAEGGADGCAAGVGLTGASSVLASGPVLYVGGQNTIAAFQRSGNGEFKQLSGGKACIDNDGSDGCTLGYIPGTIVSLTWSLDLQYLYAAASNAAGGAVLVFQRNNSDGSLSEIQCYNTDGSHGCTMGTKMLDPTGITIHAPNSVYVAAHGSNAIDIFDRNNSNGMITQKAGTAGCIDDAGVACQMGYGLTGIRGITLYKTNKFLWATATDRVVNFARDKHTGVLTQLPGIAKCISKTGDGGQCDVGAGLGGAYYLDWAAGGKSLYVSSSTDDAVVALHFH